MSKILAILTFSLAAMLGLTMAVKGDDGCKACQVQFTVQGATQLPAPRPMPKGPVIAAPVAAPQVGSSCGSGGWSFFARFRSREHAAVLPSQPIRAFAHRVRGRFHVCGG